MWNSGIWFGGEHSGAGLMARFNLRDLFQF